jgi:tRNA (guanine37-N1)-methyltransferase
VLLSGHHDRIEQWRRQQSLRRTAQHRPDLLHRSQALTLDALETAEAAEVRLARPGDVAELYVLQRCCWLSEAQANETLDIPALEESLDDVAASLAAWTTLVVHANGRLVASVRARLGDRAVWEIGRLMVAPDLEHRGIGRWLLARIESAAPPEATSYQLFTGARSERNLRMYRRAGYRRAASGPGGRPLADEPPGVAVLTKRVGRDDFS